jgi:sugar-phosphatase
VSNDARSEELPAVLFSCTAVILGLDGVLVDSRLDTRAAWHIALEESGLTLDDISCDICGRSPFDAARRVARGEPDAVQTRLAKRVTALRLECAWSTQRMPGASTFIGPIPVERWAIATPSLPELALEVMVCAGVPTPLALVASDQFHAPEDRYLIAAEELKIPEPWMCVVVEDSPAAIVDAKRAGMRVLGVATTFPAEELTEADWVVPDLRDLTIVAIPDGLAISRTHPGPTIR